MSDQKNASEQCKEFLNQLEPEEFADFLGEVFSEKIPVPEETEYFETRFFVGFASRVPDDGPEWELRAVAYLGLDGCRLGILSGAMCQLCHSLDRLFEKNALSRLLFSRGFDRLIMFDNSDAKHLTMTKLRHSPSVSQWFKNTKKPATKTSSLRAFR